VEQYKRLVSAYPQEMEYRLGAGESGATLGDLLRERGDPEKGLAYLNEAVRALETVFGQQVLRAQAKKLLSEALANRARTRTALRASAEALADWDRAISLSDEEERSALRLGRATSLASSGKHVEAAAEAAKAQNQASLPADGYYQLGLLYAACSAAARRDAGLDKSKRERLTDEYAARAVASLKKAAVRDYFKKAAKRERLDKEKSLAGLRSRADFHELQASLKR
jgi:tetratricopeptide (TPR) repeat protein